MSRFNMSHRLTAVDLDIDKRRRKGKGDEDFAGTHHQTIPKYVFEVICVRTRLVLEHRDVARIVLSGDGGRSRECIR